MARLQRHGEIRGRLDVSRRRSRISRSLPAGARSATRGIHPGYKAHLTDCRTHVAAVCFAVAVPPIATHLGHAMITRNAMLLALCVPLLLAAAPTGASAQQPKQQKPDSMWGINADLKPLMPLPTQPFLPPNSSITAGSAGGSTVSTPLFDPTRDEARPGLRLTIPTR